MKCRARLVAAILAAVCIFAPAATVLAEEPGPAAGFWSELISWISAVIEGDELPLEALELEPPANALTEPEVSILIPPGG